MFRVNHEISPIVWKLGIFDTIELHHCPNRQLYPTIAKLLTSIFKISS
jgi:hypothetical protein